MVSGKIALSFLVLSTLFLNGCTLKNKPTEPGDLQVIVGNGVTRAANDPGPIVGNKDDQQSVIEPLKELIKKWAGKEITNFQTGQSMQYNDNLFINFSYQIEKKPYYGVAHAYVNKNGWVIAEMEINCGPVFKQFPVMCCMKGGALYNQFEKNFVTDDRYLLLSGYINDDRVRAIKLSFEDGNYFVNVNKGQKTYMYLYTGTSQYKSFTAFDEHWKVIHKQ